MTSPLGSVMKCGHAAQGTVEKDGQRIPACLICLGADGRATEPDDDVGAQLRGRKARCDHYGQTPDGPNHSSNHGCQRGQPCMCEEPSEKAINGKLAFFKHNPHAPVDRFYCGCWGWE